MTATLKMEGDGTTEMMIVIVKALAGARQTISGGGGVPLSLQQGTRVVTTIAELLVATRVAAGVGAILLLLLLMILGQVGGASIDSIGTPLASSCRIGVIV